jgi:type IV pilus assembly protein PilQ
MKMKTTSLMLLFAACLTGVAQDKSPSPEAVPKASPPAEVTTPATAPAPTPPTEAPASAPALAAVPAPAAPADGTTPATAADPALAQNTTPATANAPAANAASAGSPTDVVPLIVIEDVPLTDAIRNLARQSSLNFQFDPRVTSSNQPTISIRFENVTAQEALNAVLENYNLALVKDTKSKIARITVKDPKAEDPLVSRVVQLRYSDPTNLVLLVKSTLSQRSTVVSDGRTSQLIVTTTEREMDNVISLVNRLDAPTKQVLIEAKLFETSKAPSTIKGIDWTGTLQNQHVQFGNNTPPAIAGTRTDPEIPSRIFDGGPKVTWNSVSGFFPGMAFLNADGANVVLSFLNKDADTEVLSTPRAVTLDNQMAPLSVTRAFPIFQVTPGSANSAAGATVTYTNLGTILYVTPRIAADKNVSMRVVPEVSNIDSKDSQTLNSTLNTANIYAVRRMETSVMVPSGTTLVMGGMLSDSQTKSFTKVPILGDLPGLGWAFRQEGKSRNKANLLIFLTPTILEDDAFHVTSSGSDFLKTRYVERAEAPASAWDSAKAHDWTKPVE